MNPLYKSGIKVGRDKLQAILQDHKLILRRKRQISKTTNSNHSFKKYRTDFYGLCKGWRIIFVRIGDRPRLISLI